MSIASTCIAEGPIGALVGTAPANTKNVPPKRQVQAVADTAATPEPR
jgi:hypothetical protein